jgi:pimeloyl-ACP methyl ester carboxylesterase
MQRICVRLPIVLALLAPLWGACSDGGNTKTRYDFSVPDAGAADAYPNVLGGNPLVPEVAAYPFPSDFYLVKDSATLTGRRVKLPAEVLPKLISPGMFDGDGFTRIPLILASLPGGVATASLPADPAASLAATASVLLVKIGSWERVPILAETDLTDVKVDRRALIIRPLVALTPRAGYVVIIRDTVQTAAGKPHSAGAAFAALRDGVTTEVAAIEQQREDFKQVNAAIKALKLDPQKVVLAWSFHVRSEEEVTATLLALQDYANTAPLGGYTISSDKTETSGTKTNRQIVGTFKINDFIDKAGLINLDAAGKPKSVGQADAEFKLTIPSTIDGPRPVILFGHGFFGSAVEGTRGSFNDMCTKNRFSSIGTHIGFNDTNQVIAFKGLASDLSMFKQMSANVQQNLTNYTTLARLVKEKLVKDLTKDDGKGSFAVVDPQQVHYLGISNGGTFGYVVAATSPQLTRAVLVVGGGGLVHFLQRAEPWNGYKPFVQMLYKDSRERQLMMSLMQQLIDPIDSMNYAERLVNKRFAGLKPLRASIHMAIHDSQVRNLVTEWVVRTAEIPMITPSPKQVWGLKTITAAPPAGASVSTLGALYVYDEKVKPAPVGNIPPAVDNKTHQTVRDLDVYQQQVAAFIEGGKIVQVCSGSCDPK